MVCRIALVCHEIVLDRSQSALEIRLCGSVVGLILVVAVLRNCYGSQYGEDCYGHQQLDQGKTKLFV